MKQLVKVLLTVIVAVSCTTQPQNGIVKYVDPFIGTGGKIGLGHGNTFPGAAYPFGMIQLSPDNGGQGWEYCSGYSYQDSFIVGFSHTHLSGTGVGDFADISLMPTTKDIDEKYFIQEDEFIREFCEENDFNPNGFLNKDGEPAAFTKNYLLKYRSEFSHDQESASPGYYYVKLLDDNIHVELTTSEFVGMHRYQFDKSSEKQSVVLNLGFNINRDRPVETYINKRTAELVTGYRFSNGWANVHKVYFAMEFSRPIDELNFFNADQLDSSNSASGEKLAGVFTFSNKRNEPLLVKVAISSTNEEGAMSNLATADSFGWDFDKLHQSTKEKWNDELGKIIINSKFESKKTTFYTALYHSYIAPFRFSDVDGTYKNYLHENEKAEGYAHYTVLSLWDTFRALKPLLAIMQPELYKNIIQSMISQYKQTGSLPYWEIAGNEGGSMIGYHSIPIIADAIFKNIGTYDTELLYEAMLAASNTDRKGLGYYREFHFVPTDKDDHGTVSKTLEYAYDDWCIAQVAKYLGKSEDYINYMDRSNYYKNVFDTEYKLMRGKRIDGSWDPDFHPRFAQYGNVHTVEGNTWQYSFFVPHDMTGLIELMGGENDFEMMLDSLFEQTSELLGKDTEDVTGQIGQYAHGNEPSHHAAYLYDFIDKPGKTQYYTNKIIDSLYFNAPNGLCGNEDCGQMSAWYVFSAVGFYPVNPVDSKYYFGSPQFEEVEIYLPNGNVFKVKARNVSKQNFYIKSVKLNGELIDREYITYNEIEEGGILEFDMSNSSKDLN